MIMRISFGSNSYTKGGLLVIILFLVSFSHCQKVVTGKVVSYKGKPLDGASVYLNNTTIGTLSAEDGSFELLVNEGNYELIISFIGYRTRIENLNIIHYSEPLKFALIPETTILEEVIVKPTIYNDEWKRNLQTFKNTFLGRTKLAASCKILNPKALHFEISKDKSTLTAITREPLKIRNKGLGYLKEYDLVDYSLNKSKLAYIGYSRYRDLPGGKSKQRRWKKNRRKAYNGSRLHFVRSLLNKSLREDGFAVDQFRRTINEDRPSDQEIIKARQILKKAGTTIDYTKKIVKPKNALDSAIVIVRKVNMPKYHETIYKKNVPYEDIIYTNNGITFLDFKNFLLIRYLKEKEEPNYLNYLRHRQRVGAQTSKVTLLSDRVILDPNGKIIKPLDYYSEGYWAYEQYADMLPLDYQPYK